MAGRLCFLMAALTLMPEAANEERAAPGSPPGGGEQGVGWQCVSPIALPEGMTVPPKHQTADGSPSELTSKQIERLEGRYGNRFLLEPAPDNKLPKSGMGAEEAMRLIGEEMVLDGIPMRNLATFVTTWMEPEANRVIQESLHTNFIDHAEYPQTAEIEQRCIRMLADLFHAPAKTTGARTQGSSEAIMLGALSLKWKWRARREAAGKATDRPNLVFGGDVHVVWEKFCRYFDVEPRIVPLGPEKYTIGAEDVEPHVDENTIGVAAVLGTTFTGHADDIRGINDYLVTLKNERGLDVPLHVDAASGGFVWPFLYPHSEWDFRLEQVRSINVSGHKFGLVYPGIGWLVFREESDLAEDLVFYENYLGKRDATFTLNFSTGSSMVLAQYYNFVRFGHSGYRYIMETMKYNARTLATEIAAIGAFEIIGAAEDEQLPLVAFKLSGEHSYDEFDVAAQLAAERGWMLPAYTLPPNAEHVKIMRALVKQTLSHSLVTTLGADIAGACATLEQKGGLHPSDRKRVKTNTGF
jgi:glutamate decarboxylase